MERMDESLIKKKYLINEHYARYHYFLNLMEGHVVDCACGIGYASEIILQNKNVDMYTGIDISQESIDIATKNYKRNGATKFFQGQFTNINLGNNSVDSFISMETLEHVEESKLDTCFEEICRVLKKTGKFFGSVPIDFFDNKCNEIYGYNQYHITRFSYESLKELLNKYFEYVDIGTISCQVLSRYKKIEHTAPENIQEEFSNTYNDNLGSFIFVCSNQKIDFKFTAKNYFSQSLVEYDEEQVMPLFNAMKYAENLALEREVIINSYEARFEDIKNALIYAENLALEREIIINSYEAGLEDIKNALTYAENLALEREVIIKEMDAYYSNLLKEKKLNNKDYKKKKNEH